MWKKNVKDGKIFLKKKKKKGKKAQERHQNFTEEEKEKKVHKYFHSFSTINQHLWNELFIAFEYLCIPLKSKNILPVRL